MASSNPVFSANGEYLTFSTAKGPGIVRLDGSGATFPITDNPSGVFTPILSPDGEVLYFVSSDRTGVRGTIRGLGIWALYPNGSLDEIMERDSKFSILTSNYLIPAISHDGARIAYYRRALFTGDVTIEESNVDGANANVITRPRAGFKFMQFNYSHDGKLLAMLECLESDPVPTHCDIVVWDFTTRTLRWVTSKAAEISSPVFGLDDQTLYFLEGNRIADQKVKRISIDGSGESILIERVHGAEVDGNAAGNTLSLAMDPYASP